MGRGLAAILAVAEDDGARGPELRELSVELIAPNAQQPRHRFDEDALESLTASVRERGLLQPVLVRPRPGGRYELVAGGGRGGGAPRAPPGGAPPPPPGRGGAGGPPAAPPGGRGRGGPPPRRGG